MRFNSEIEKEVVSFCESAEKKFVLKCAVVRNKYRIPFNLNDAPFSLIMLPFSGDSEKDFEFKSKALLDEYNKSLFLRKWHCYLSSIYDSRPWFTLFLESKERFPLKHMAAGGDLISPVIYGEENIAKLKKEAELFFGQGIIEFWEREAEIQHAKKLEKIEAAHHWEIAYHKERKRLLNRLEIYELKKAVLFVADKCLKEKASLVVALDGSGRPFGKALEWYGICCPVCYLDPRHMREIDFDKKSDDSWVLEALKREFPEIQVALSKDPRSVLFIDDQTGYGVTVRSLEWLSGFFSENHESSLNYVAMTQYMKNNTPSWLRKRDIQGLEPAPKESMRAIEKPTPKSKRFYKKLKRIVSTWKL